MSSPFFKSEPGDLWLSPGVLPEEEPKMPSPDNDQCAVSNLADWDGVRVGFNLLPYLLRAHEMAPTLGSKRVDAKVHIVTAGIGRIIREYGIDATEELIAFKIEESQAASPPPPERIAFLNRILELEKIRTAVVSAAIATLRLEDNQGALFGVTQRMIEDAEWRSAFFEHFRELKKDLEENIDFYGDRLSFGSALERALPRRLRRQFDRSSQQLSAESQADLLKELDYLIEEGALAASIILDRDGYYAVHKGGDQADLPRRKKTLTSTTDCLRVAIASRVGNILDQNGREKMFDRWVVSEELDGQGFFPRKGGAGSSERTERMTPYYWYPGKAGNSGNGGNDEAAIIMPFSPPLVPWEHGWWSRHANSGAGGIAQGQPSAVFESMVAPVMRRHLALAMRDATSDALLHGRYHGAQYTNLRDWVEKPDTAPLIPDGFTLTDVNDIIRALGQETAKRAWAILNPVPKLE